MNESKAQISRDELSEACRLIAIEVNKLQRSIHIKREQVIGTSGRIGFINGQIHTIDVITGILNDHLRPLLHKEDDEGRSKDNEDKQITPAMVSATWQAIQDETKKIIKHVKTREDAEPFVNIMGIVTGLDRCLEIVDKSMGQLLSGDEVPMNRTITPKDVAQSIDPIDKEILDGLGKYNLDLLTENGLVIVYGDSDDKIQAIGAFSDKFGVQGNSTLFVANGVMSPGRLENSQVIQAFWDPGDGTSWKLETDIPKAASFRIYETMLDDTSPFGNGIVFCIDDLE